MLVWGSVSPPAAQTCHPILPGGCCMGNTAVLTWGDAEWAGLGTSPCFWVAVVMYTLAGGSAASAPPQVGSQPGGKGGNGSGKWAPCQSAGSLALKCWENLKKGEMFVGGKRSE